MCPILVQSQYSNLRGIYQQDQKWWHCADNSSCIFLNDDRWVISRENTDGKTFLASAHSHGEFPWDANWNHLLLTLSPLEILDASSSPQAIRIECKYNNIAGGYRRLEDDIGGYPHYENSEKGVFLWYCRTKNKWLITRSDRYSGHFVAVDNPATDPTTIPLREWGEHFTAVAPITWDSNVPAVVSRDFFYDVDFLPGQQALGMSKGENVEWIRCHDLFRGESAVLYDVIEPKDLLQGQVGDCWLIASIAALAEYSAAVEKLFLQYDQGRCDVRIFDVTTDNWVVVTIDDYVPCNPRQWYTKTAELLFAQPKGNEVWCLLLEKAFAKFVGNYHALSGGSTSFAWQCLTGCAEQWMLAKRDNGWKSFSADLKLQKEEIIQGDRKALPFTRKAKDVIYDTEGLFHFLVKNDLNGYLMSSSIEGEGEEYERKDGLVEDHAYSIIQVIEMDGQRLLQLRNPWGNDKEWKGAWSDSSDCWERYAHIGTAVNHTIASDGIFWMHFDDWRQIFTCVNVCPVAMPRLHMRPANDILDGLLRKGVTGVLEEEDEDLEVPEELEVAPFSEEPRLCTTTSPKVLLPPSNNLKPPPSRCPRVSLPPSRNLEEARRVSFITVGDLEPRRHTLASNPLSSSGSAFQSFGSDDEPVTNRLEGSVIRRCIVPDQSIPMGRVVKISQIRPSVVPALRVTRSVLASDVVSRGTMLSVPGYSFSGSSSSAPPESLVDSTPSSPSKLVSPGSTSKPLSSSPPQKNQPLSSSPPQQDPQNPSISASSQPDQLYQIIKGPDDKTAQGVKRSRLNFFNFFKSRK